MERKLAAILCADVYGYSRLMGDDEEATLRTLTSHRKLIDSQIEQHHGRFVNSAGDSVLAEFASVVEAVNCAVDIQTGLKAENANLPFERRMEFRIGVNLGDVMVEGDQILGDGVNVAARVESLAEPGGISISGIVHDQVRDRLPLSYEDCGEQTVKNIARPVHVWRVLLDGATPPSRGARGFPRKYRRASALSFAGLAIVIATIILVQHVSIKPQPTHASIPPQEKPALPLPSIPSIAVLPFANLSGDPSQDYFSDGLTDLLITRLSKVPGVFVIARASSFSYKGKAATIQEVGRQLGVRTILEGSLLKTRDRIRINAQLADAASGATLWAQSFELRLKDILAMQDDIARGIVTTLGLLFKVNNPQLRSIVREDLQTDNVDAFDAELRCLQSFWKFTKDDNTKARQMCQRAATLDPNYAKAYADVGWTYETDAIFQWSHDPGADLKRAFVFAQKALALDDSNAMALALVSDNDRLSGRFDEAVRDAQRAVAADPNNSWVYWFLAQALDADGKPDDAVQTIQKAIRLDPALEDWFAVELGSAYLHSGRYQQALSTYKRHATTYPNNLWGHFGLAIAYTEFGRDRDAQAEAAEVMRLNPQFTLPPPELLSKDVAWRRRAYADLRKAGLK